VLQGGLSGGCGLAVQALVAAVAVGELALCSPPSGASSDAVPSRVAADSNDGAAAGVAAAAATDTAAAAAAAAPKLAVNELAAMDPMLLLRLVQCSMSLGEHALHIARDAAEWRKSQMAAMWAGDPAAGSSGSASDGGRQRLLERTVQAEAVAAKEASARLLATAVAGLAGLTAVLAVAAAQRPSGATGQRHDAGPAAKRLPDAEDGRTMGQLLRQSAELAASTLNAAEYMPAFAADFIEVRSIRIQPSSSQDKYMLHSMRVLRILLIAAPICAVAARLDGNITGT
jgi:hypothetical protein